MAFLLIVPPGEGARLQGVRNKVPFLQEFSVCENVMAFAMPPGFDGKSACLALLREIDSDDFALLEYGGMIEGDGHILTALASATHATVLQRPDKP